MKTGKNEDRGDNPGCMLKRWPEDEKGSCREGECAHCGWNPEVDARRKEENRRKYAVKK